MLTIKTRYQSAQRRIALPLGVARPIRIGHRPAPPVRGFLYLVFVPLRIEDESRLRGIF